jgi:non-ribosomal peptide synthetase component E (peptide arylation enzyme)
MREWFEKKTLGTLLDEAAVRWGAREALTYEGQRWSFAELQTEVDRTGSRTRPLRIMFRALSRSGCVV